jgi:glutamine synthetase
VTPTVPDILDQWAEQGITWVRFELPDLHGTARIKMVPIGKAADFAAEGLNFYGGAQVLDSRSDVVPDSLYNTETHYADQLVTPDPSTAAVIPWQPGHARFICSAHSMDGTPRLASPRQLLERVLGTAREMGYDILTGSEYENYFLQPDGTPLFGGYHIFNPVRNLYHPVVLDLLEQLPKVGLDLITHNAEYGPGQFEINFAPARGLAGPDDTFTYKNAVKEIAHRHGLIGTFMSKPISGMSGCGAHFHISLLDAGSGRSVTGEDGGRDGLSDAARAFIAGNLKYAKPVYTLLVPTVNCIKRRRPHTFSPSNISWGLEDRSALIRIKGVSERSRHIEHRAPSGLSNPYIVAAGVVAAGLLGIREGLELEPQSGPGPAEDDPKYEQLPWSVRESLDHFERCEPLRELLGEEFVQVWLAVRRYELARFEDHVTDWERTEYLEIY